MRTRPRVREVGACRTGGRPPRTLPPRSGPGGRGRRRASPAARRTWGPGIRGRPGKPARYHPGGGRRPTLRTALRSGNGDCAPGRLRLARPDHTSQSPTSVIRYPMISRWRRESGPTPEGPRPAPHAPTPASFHQQGRGQDAAGVPARGVQAHAVMGTCDGQVDRRRVPGQLERVVGEIETGEQRPGQAALRRATRERGVQPVYGPERRSPGPAR